MTTSAPERRLVQAGMVISVLLAGAESYVISRRGLPPQIAPGSQISILTANLVGAFLCSLNAREHESRTPMWCAWNLLSAGLVANASRTLFEIVFQLTVGTDSRIHPMLGLRQVPIVASMLFTAAGLWEMWRSFASLGLGVQLRKVDWALMGGILLLVPPVVWSRFQMNDARSPLVWIRWAQFASPFLLAISGSMAVVLYRISREMGAGLIANMLRCLATAFSMRLLALVFTTAFGLPDNRAPVTFFRVSNQVLLVGAHWLLLLGLVYRRGFSQATTDLIEQYAIHPRSQLAALTPKKFDP